MSVLADLRRLHDERPTGVRRAWPGTDGSLTLETLDEDGRLRAGRLDAEGLVLAPHGVDRKLPALRVAPGARLVVHRLYKRAVLADGDRFTKALRRGRAVGVAAASEDVARACRTAGLRAAPVLEATDDAVTFGRLDGTTLHDLGDAGLEGWAALARAWPALAAGEVGVTGSATVGVHDAAREAETLGTWLDHADRFDALPEHRAALRAAADATVATLLDGDPDAVRLLHRDLHDKQVLWDATDGRPGLLDLDTAAHGEAALDLANLDAHLDLRVLQGVFSDGFADRVREVLVPVADAVGATPPRLRAYGRAARIRLACVYAFRPSAGTWLPAWADHAVAWGA